MATYSELLQDSRWQTRRVTILNRDGWACANPDCPGTSKQLHVHHLWYAKGRLPWQYPDKALVTLCADCHEAQHAEPAQNQWSSMAWGVAHCVLTIALILVGAVSVVAVIFSLVLAIFQGGAAIAYFLLLTLGLLVLNRVGWRLADWIWEKGYAGKRQRRD